MKCDSCMQLYTCAVGACTPIADDVYCGSYRGTVTTTNVPDGADYVHVEIPEPPEVRFVRDCERRAAMLESARVAREQGETPGMPCVNCPHPCTGTHDQMCVRVAYGIERWREAQR